jgi:hypothetical protein
MTNNSKKTGGCPKFVIASESVSWSAASPENQAELDSIRTVLTWITTTPSLKATAPRDDKYNIHATKQPVKGLIYKALSADTGSKRWIP